MSDHKKEKYRIGCNIDADGNRTPLTKEQEEKYDKMIDRMMQKTEKKNEKQI